ncbi:MAG: hypothetical protein U9O20_02085 [Patescibacteria group bacterium]|nr:hypothetical protein [Patescibacteria group bacterium]
MKKKKKEVKVSIEKLRFLLAILIVVTGGALMLFLLESDISRYVHRIEDYVLFPISIILLVTGIGIVAKNASAFK